MTITLLAGVFVLSVVILVHEFGHFIVAKALDIFVKTFSVGFGRKLLKKRIGETQYALSLLPFGGYVKFAGETQSDEKGSSENEKDEIRDSEIDPSKYFRNKRVIARSAVVFAGPFMNYILAVAIYILVFLLQGIQVLPSTAIGEIKIGSPADSAGLRAGDEVLSVDGVEVSDWNGLLENIMENKDSVKLLKVLREGEKLSIPFRSKMEGEYIVLGFYPHISTKIGRVKRDSPAFHAGMRKGAVIESINDTITESYYDLERIIHAKPEVPLVIRWSLNSNEHIDTIVPEAKKVLKEGSKTETTVVGQIGVGPYYKKKSIGLADAFEMGFSNANRMVLEILGFFKLLFTRKVGLKSLGGPILITQMAGDMARWGFNYLLYFLAFFSINLFILNLIPLLPFDGGHLFFFMIEGIGKYKIGDRKKEILTQVGFLLLIVLMIFVVLMDLSRCSGVKPGIL